MLPVIDLKEFPNQSEKLVQACKEWGCFRIVNHGIPSALLTEMKCVLISIFDHPVDIKQRNTDVMPGSCYRALDLLHEALGLYDSGSSEAVEEFCNRFAVTLQQRYESLDTHTYHRFSSIKLHAAVDAEKQ